MKLILASQSPRRRELLSQIGLEYEVCPKMTEERITKEEPSDAVQELAEQKALATAEVYEEGIILGADTIVVLNGRSMGKPADEAEAVRMLGALQGKTHSVFTGVSLLVKKDGKIEKKISFAEETKVTMYSMKEDEICWYVLTKDGMDKAGAYGIQGKCARFIAGIEGDYNTVVGLPAARIYQELRREGLLWNLE